MYNVDYFIAKFEAIPDDKWCTDVFNSLTGQSCALGHCGAFFCATDTKESTALWSLFGIINHPVHQVNDGRDRYSSLGSTPKERIINTLKKIRGY